MCISVESNFRELFFLTSQVAEKIRFVRLKLSRVNQVVR